MDLKLQSAKRVLYLGQWNDVLRPLVVCPNLELLVSLERTLDGHFYATPDRDPCDVISFEEDILAQLRTGSERSSVTRINDDGRDLELPHGACSDVVVERTGLMRSIKFTYNGMRREYRTYDMDFHYYTSSGAGRNWPNCINTIDCVMAMGTCITCDRLCVFKKIFQRTASTFVFVTQRSFYESAPEIVLVFGRDGTEVGRLSATVVDKSLFSQNDCHSWFMAMLAYDGMQVATFGNC